ncbi:MAG: glycosyltransferase family 4 protein [Muribaculaceae bacterium]|nr:glycosyltransferase family 4 protein [Muribaculaceae bacterium]
MKFLLVTQYFYPENFKCNDIAFELQRRGHEVTVITGIPNYPDGKYFKGYGLCNRRKEIINGVKVERSILVSRGGGGGIRLALNYLSFALFASIRAMRLALTKRYDAILVHEVSPITVGIPAVIAKKIQKIPLHFWVLDLWPESLTAAGGVTNRKILSFFEKITKWIYKNSTTLLIGSKGYRKSINEKGDFNQKIIYFPNWVENQLKSNNSDQFSIPEFPSGFNIVIAGNMGDAQDLPNVMEAAKILKGENLNFIFVGDGRKREFVEQFSKENDLKNQIFCLGRFPLEAMPTIFNEADILFMALKDQPIFSMTVPSRLQAYMSSGKPIVAMINGEGADLIKEANCGWSVEAENPKALADLLLTLSKEKTDILKEKGRNGQRFSEENFNFKRCMDNLEKIIDN